jgi:hypothetical protein
MPPEETHVIITLGFAEPYYRDDRPVGDGRGRRYPVTIDVEYAGPSLPPPLWVERVFVASTDNGALHQPARRGDPPGTRAARAHPAARAVGDAVTVEGQVWECVPGPAGWRRVDACAPADS